MPSNACNFPVDDNYWYAHEISRLRIVRHIPLNLLIEIINHLIDLCMFCYVTGNPIPLVVRMAERSKAPDSRISFSVHCVNRMSVLVHECGRGFESHF